MRTVDLILYVVAAVLFALAAYLFRARHETALIALGLLAWVLVPLIATARS